MEWRNRAACIKLPNELFFNHKGNKTSDQNFWKANECCRSCPVKLECLTEAINYNYETGLFALPERVRRRIKKKNVKDLRTFMRETFKVMDIIDPKFDNNGKLLSKRCLRCHRVTKGYSKDYENWGGKSHICISCFISVEDRTQLNKLLDRERPSKSIPHFNSHGELISKKCTKGWERKDATGFSRRPQGIGGKTSWCKDCTRKNLKAWQERKANEL